MKIATVERWLVRVPFHENIQWASGARSGTTRLVTRITTDAGIVGWGESLCLIDSVYCVFDAVVSKIAIGYDISEACRFHRHVLGAGYYHHKRAAVMAIAALEMAMWDALGKSARLPLSALWGGIWRHRVDACAYLLHPEPSECAARAAKFRDLGYRTFKAKIGFGEREDLGLLEAVRAEIGDLPLRADVNGAWYPGTARRMLKKMADLDLAYVEQPLPLEDLSGHAALRQAQLIPVALDESAYTLEDVSEIVRAGAADVVLLDPHQAGGLWQALKAAAICEGAYLPVTLHSGGELGISQAAYIQLAACIPNMSLAIDTERAYLSGDIVKNPMEIVEGSFIVGTEPGLGVEPDEDLLARYSVDSIKGAYLDPDRPKWFPVKPSF